MSGWILKGRILFISLAVGTYALDRVCKVLVDTRMQVGERIELVGDVLQLHHVRNRGIAFGLLADAGFLVVVASVVVGLLLFVFMLRVQPEDLVTIAGGGLITGGALGNLVDRVSYGYVIDFLSLPHWPTFNIADIGIVCGVLLVVGAQLREAGAPEPPTDAAGEHRT